MTSQGPLEITQDQMIIARSRLWTPELDKLLRRWKKQVWKREKGHLDLTRKYNQRHYFFGVPAIITSALVATGIITTFRNCDSCDDDRDECAVDEYIRLVVGILGLFAAGLTAFQTFMNYQAESEKHKSAADAYGSMFRMFDTILLVPGPIRGDPVETLQSIRNQYDDLVRRSPTLPKEYDADLSYEVVRPENLPRPPRPDQINFPRKIRIDSVRNSLSERTTNDLRKLMKDTSSEEASGTSTYEDTIEQVFADKNDHDTSDEDQEVHIAFDLDGVNCYNPSAVALAAAQFASRQNEHRQRSLQQALKFELDRLNTHASLSKRQIKSAKTLDVPPLPSEESDDTPPEDGSTNV